MDAIARIAEERIRKAIGEGEFDNLPGAGKPIVFEDETWVPEDLRPAYRVLKNAGFIPPELELKKEIVNLRDLISTLDNDAERIKKLRQLNLKIMKFNVMRGAPLYLEQFPEYEEKIFDKAGRSQR